jgi:hypothetical protein
MRPAVAALLLFLAFGQVAWQTLAIGYWQLFLADVRTVLANNRGFVPWRDALAQLPPENARRMERIAWWWTNPSLSILLSPQGRVTTLIGQVDEHGRQPFDPQKLESLPQSPQFDLSAYRAAETARATPAVR